MKSRLKSASLFSGNGRAIFLGIVLGAVLLSAISILYVRRQAALRRAEEELKLLPVSARSISPPAPSSPPALISPPAPIVVKISPDMIHISAISLGHPRMAIINGKLVGEGEQIIIHPPSASTAVSLRLVKISDGQIQLSDGAQVISVRLEVSPSSKPNS